jgi:hypothetical protein
MPHDTTDYIGMALFPAPLVLLYAPGIYDISYHIQCFAGVVFEEVVELIGFAISSSKMYIRDKNRAVSFLHSNTIYRPISDQIIAIRLQ